MTTAPAPQLFSGSLRPFPGIPAEWDHVKQRRAEAILNDVRIMFPQMLGEQDPNADIEDFWEDACRISAACIGLGGLAAKKPGTAMTPWSADEMARRLGPVVEAEEGGDHAIDSLIAHPIVHEHGGRAMLLGGLNTPRPESDVTHWLAARHRDHGIRRGIVKSIERKNGIWSIELDSDPDVVGKRLLDAMGWDYVRLDGGDGRLLAQDELELEWEYRLFVVDGKVISGAGCIEEFTPLDHDLHAGAFDARVRRVRGHLRQGDPSPVEVRPEIVEALVAFGSDLARQHGGTVVIDVAVDRRSSCPVVIELNDLPNSGLYASDPWLVTLALLDARDRGYGGLLAARTLVGAAL